MKALIESILLALSPIALFYVIKGIYYAYWIVSSWVYDYVKK